MTHQEWMLTLSPEELYDVMKWLITVKSFEFTSSRIGITEWLKQKMSDDGEQIRKEMQNVRIQTRLVITDG